MESQRRYSRVFGLWFFAVLFGVPVVLFTVIPVFTDKLEINVGFWFVTWITLCSVLLQFWVFCKWSNEGLGKVWKPVAILHALIFPGMYGMVLISMFDTDVPHSFPTEPFYWVWGIGSLLLSLWLPFTRPFAVFNILKNQSRLLVIPTLVFIPEIFGFVVFVVFMISRGI